MRIEPIRRIFCQKVLPLVYDDSLSYYETLGRLTNKLNELIESINNDLENIIVTKVEEELQRYMLDAMYESSTETIVITLETIQSIGDNHTYDYQTSTMSIGE